jgi:adenylosuccinate lyase
MLALFAGTMDKMAREIRNLQRNEIAEAFEPFNQNQVGSSTMPHKRNPHKSEQICSIARYIRGIVTPALETIALEHERDLTNSALERIIIPEGFILTDYIIRQMISIQKGLTFDSDNIERNLNLTLGLCLTERVMIELVAKGLGRQKGHEMMRRLAMKCWEEKRPLRDVMLEDTEVAKYVNSKEIDTWLDPHTYIGTAVEQVNNVVKILTKEL